MANRAKQIADNIAETARGITGIGVTMERTALAVRRMGDALANVVVQRYIDAGLPYGGTVEGLQRWLDEEDEKSRLRA